LLFTLAILTHFFEKPAYTVIASLIAVPSIVWYALLLRTIRRSATIEV
jgi:hypothetical protein